MQKQKEPAKKGNIILPGLLAIGLGLASLAFPLAVFFGFDEPGRPI
ncbi:MAG: hypothetical protein HYX96_06390 [Chloroflexi bacterium]|nr:hypothetical protein [Chloroflexota bacterium]